MTFIGKLRAGAAALIIAGAASEAVPAYAQDGGTAGGAANIANPIGAASMRNLFPLNAFPMPQTAGAGGFGGVGDRVTTRERKVPDREERILINLGNKHINAIFGGMGQGSGFGGGIELTTADSIDGVELYGSAIGTFKKYR